MKNVTALIVAFSLIGFSTMAAFAHEGEDHNKQGQNPQHDDPANQGQNGGQHKQNDQHKNHKHDRKHKDQQNDGHQHQH